MGKLRDAMQRDMELKNFSPKTMRCYLYLMSRYALHYRKPPDELGDSDIKAFLHFLRKEKKVSQSYMNQAYSALKFFYETTLGRAWNGAQIPRCKRGRKLPVILSREEVQSILCATENLKHLTILATIYSGGLRLSEAAELKLTDIDSQRMLIHVRGKGDKDRYTLLGKNALHRLLIMFTRSKIKALFLIYVLQRLQRQVFHAENPLHIQKHYKMIIHFSDAFNKISPHL